MLNCSYKSQQWSAVLTHHNDSSPTSPKQCQLLLNVTTDDISSIAQNVAIMQKKQKFPFYSLPSSISLDVSVLTGIFSIATKSLAGSLISNEF